MTYQNLRNSFSHICVDEEVFLLMLREIPHWSHSVRPWVLFRTLGP